MTFSVRQFLREIPVRTLKAYFGSKNAVVPPEWWKHKEPKLISELWGYLSSGTDQIGAAILAEMVRIHPMAIERGRNALLNAALRRDGFVEQFGALANDYERALWVFMEHSDIFREGEELQFFDYYSEGNRGRHYRTTPNRNVSREAVGRRRIQDRDVPVLSSARGVRHFLRHRVRGAPPGPQHSGRRLCSRITQQRHGICEWQARSPGLEFLARRRNRL
jgi:hypothetical protein